MDAKDILRIVLFFVIAIFALREFLFFRMRNVTQLNTEEEHEETVSQPFHQQSQNKRDDIMIEQLEYENELSEMK